MKGKKLLGFILLVVGSGLGAISLLFTPIAMYGVYLLLGEYQQGMSAIVKLIISVVVGFGIPMLIATIVSFMLY